MFIEVMAPIPEAYLRMAHAMEEVKKFLIPVCFQAYHSNSFMYLKHINIMEGSFSLGQTDLQYH